MAKWYFLLNKRFLKKPGFLLILGLAPLLAAGMRLAAQGESGMMRVALCMRNPADELSVQIVEELMESRGVFHYLLCETEEEARARVMGFEADAAWVFPEDLGESLRRGAFYKSVEPAVTVVEREDSVPLIFAREVLSKSIYPYFCYAVYEEYVRRDLALETDDAELEAAYRSTLAEGNFFRMEYPDGQAEERVSYLLTPMRGILAVWLVLCGFAASMYDIQDERKGTFARMPVRDRIWLGLGTYAVVLSDAVLVLLAACKCAGIFGVWHRELLSVFLFACCTMAFCCMVRLLCRTTERLGGCVPVLLLGMLALCPVFLDVGAGNAVRYLLPPNYYLKSIHSASYLYGMVIYTAAAVMLCILISRLQGLRR